MEYFDFIQQYIKQVAAIDFICMILICVVCFIDMWTGIDAAKANKEKIRSRPLRKTGAKIVDYFKFIICFMMIDILSMIVPFYEKPYGIVISTLGAIVVEILSVMENLKKKKSHAAEAAGFIEEIISCTTPDKAAKLLKSIKNSHDRKKADQK